MINAACYLSPFTIMSAAITPGSQQQIVNIVVIRIEPQPLSRTAIAIDECEDIIGEDSLEGFK